MHLRRASATITVLVAIGRDIGQYLSAPVGQLSGRCLRAAPLRLGGSGDSGDPAQYLESLDISYPIGDGNPFVETYAVGTYGLPTLYVIDRAGSVAKLIVGFSDESEANLVDAVEAALRSSAT